MILCAAVRRVHVSGVIFIADARGEGAAHVVPILRMNKAVKLDKCFNPIWTYEISTPWSAVEQPGDLQ